MTFTATTAQLIACTVAKPIVHADDELLALAKVLASVGTAQAACALTDEAQYLSYLEARKVIDNAADDVIHASRASRRVAHLQAIDDLARSPLAPVLPQGGQDRCPDDRVGDQQREHGGEHAGREDQDEHELGIGIHGPNVAGEGS